MNKASEYINKATEYFKLWPVMRISLAQNEFMISEKQRLERERGEILTKTDFFRIWIDERRFKK